MWALAHRRGGSACGRRATGGEGLGFFNEFAFASWTGDCNLPPALGYPKPLPAPGTTVVTMPLVIETIHKTIPTPLYPVPPTKKLPVLLRPGRNVPG